MMIKLINPRTVLKLLSFWPPYLGAGIYVKSVNEDFTKVEVRMKLRFYNTNYVGTHFGGSLYSMCDPFLMFILLHHLREEHIVWDKGATIEYLKPAKGSVSATFKVSLAQVEKIIDDCQQNFSVEPKYTIDILDSQKQVVARVTKTLYVRRKDAKKRFSKKVNSLD